MFPRSRTPSGEELFDLVKRKPQHLYGKPRGARVHLHHNGNAEEARCPQTLAGPMLESPVDPSQGVGSVQRRLAIIHSSKSNHDYTSAMRGVCRGGRDMDRHLVCVCGGVALRKILSPNLGAQGSEFDDEPSNSEPHKAPMSEKDSG